MDQIKNNCLILQTSSKTSLPDMNPTPLDTQVREIVLELFAIICVFASLLLILIIVSDNLGQWHDLPI